MNIAGLIGDAACLVAASYAVVALACVWRRRVAYRSSSRSSRCPPVTLLKPLCGRESGLYECLRSCCEQDYPDFQIVFGVRSRVDPAVAVVERLQREYPQLDLTLVVDEHVYGANYKVSNLMNMLPAARHETLVIADSDVRVARDYLARVVAPLEARGVGLTTCLYRARPLGGIWSRLGAMYVNGWFIPSVATAATFGWPALAFGATIALRRQVLEQAGGLPSIRRHIADDYMLGYRVRQLGLRTVLAPCVVETMVPRYRWRDLVSQELRQARVLRRLQPVGYGFAFLTFGMPLCAGMLAAPGVQRVWAGAALMLIWVVKLGLNAAVGPATPRRLAEFALVPLRDLVGLGVWLAAYAGNRIVWRGRRFSVARDGSLTELPVRLQRRAAYIDACWRLLRKVRREA